MLVAAVDLRIGIMIIVNIIVTISRIVLKKKLRGALNEKTGKSRKN